MIKKGMKKPDERYITATLINFRNDFVCRGKINAINILNPIKSIAVIACQVFSFRDSDPILWILSNKYKKYSYRCLDIQNNRILAVLNFVNGACTCPKRRGLFLLSPHRYGGGVLRENKILSPVDGFSSVSATAFLLVQNQNIIAMLSKSTSAIGTPIGQSTSDQIIKDLLLTDDITRMRQHLLSMAESYVLSEDEQKYRRDVYSTYKALDIMLSKVEKINAKSEKI
jgi:hypothetical protein